MPHNQLSHRIELKRLRSRMTEQGRSVDEIAMEIQRRYGYSLRAAYRHAIGLTLYEAAESYNLAVDDADAHLDVSRLSGWENWPRNTQRRPTVFNLVVLSKVYGTHPARLVTTKEQERLDYRDRTVLRLLAQLDPTAGTTPALPHTQNPLSKPSTLPANIGLRTPWTTSECLRILHAVTETELMEPIERRMFASLTGAAVTAPAHEWLITPAHPATTRPRSSTLPTDTVDDLDAITATLRQADDQKGGATLLNTIRDKARNVVDLIGNASYPKTTGRRLHSTAAELLRLAGWSCFEANDHALAQRYWLAALRAAHTAGDHALGANILGFMSYQATELGQAREAVTLADTARAGYRGNSPSVTAMINLRACWQTARTCCAVPARRSAAFSSFQVQTAVPGTPRPCISSALIPARDGGGSPTGS